jgi:hypothetical protein
MCPACIAAAAQIAAGVASAGGVAALIVKKLRAETGTEMLEPTIRTGGE